MGDGPVFPLHLVRLRDRTRSVILSPEHLAWQFEDYDSSDADYTDYEIVYDAKLRRVWFTVDLMRELTELSLTSSEPSMEAAGYLDEHPLVKPKVSLEAVERHQARPKRGCSPLRGWQRSP